MPTHYKIGTRGSLLALTQCGQVKDQLEKLTGDTFELVVIKTQGDIIQNAPLWQLDGKDFFTKELDEALLSGAVDLVVHSYKDLGSVRPEGITLAAVTKRTFAHDVLLIRNETIPTIATKKEFIVGTSSPRRIVNIEKYLSAYLPKADSQLMVKTKMLRGNVNTRIQKLVDGEFDAIVLALPGIERLALTPSSNIELTRLLKNINFMVLPQSQFPSSASQGALGIECSKNRHDHGELLQKLKKMEDPSTLEEVSRERLAFNKYGGGCHLAVGINVKKIVKNQRHYFIHSHKGFLEGNDIDLHSLEAVEGRNLPTFLTPPKHFNGHPKNDELIIKESIPVELPNESAIYVTSKYCFHALKANQANSLYAAGTKTMKELAKLGYWVNGSADSNGDEEIKLIRSSQALALMVNHNSPLYILSNDQAQTTIEKAILKSCYTRKINSNVGPVFEQTMNNCEVFFWSSFHQYQTYTEKFPSIKNKIHTCGLGKTLDQFLEKKIDIIPMASMNEFNQWIGSTSQI